MRRLDPEEERLWARVVASVRPLDGVTVPAVQSDPAPLEPVGPSPRLRRRAVAAPSPAAPAPGTTLDGTWDRRLGRGLVAPESTLDLHGHNLAVAYDLLDRWLDKSIRTGARLLLLITGKPPGPAGGARRGAIRAAVGDWLQASRHAGAIAAVRNAHPRHGGAGAIYIVLRRPRR